jgi:hypothetical protein
MNEQTSRDHMDMLADTQPRISWITTLILVLALACTAVWPSSIIRIHLAQLLFQPALLVLLIGIGWWQLRAQQTVGCVLASLAVIYTLYALAAWLPWVREGEGAPYASGYRYVLYAYEAVVAAALSWISCRAVWRAIDGVRVQDRWWALLGGIPVLLVIRGCQSGSWLSVPCGVVMGVAAACGALRWMRHGIPREYPRWVVPTAVCVVAWLIAYAAGLRIYGQTGVDFPIASDDGDSYFRQAVAMAAQPLDFFSDRLHDQLFFTGYYPLMALWFMLVGSAHIPSWLFWHGVAGGLLALSVFALGRRLGGAMCGLIAVAGVIGNHVMLHLMGTLNMETLFVPALYVVLWLWVVAGERTTERNAYALWTGVTLGIATIVRPTSVLFPVALGAVVLWESSSSTMRRRCVELWRMVYGFAIPVALLYIRNRIAWGQWTLASDKAQISMQVNKALIINGQHLSELGWGPWLGELLQHPQVLLTQLIPQWTDNVLRLWTHRGFGQMDLLKGLNYVGPYQAVISNVMLIGVLIGVVAAIRQRHRLGGLLLLMPVYFSALTVPFLVLNSRYRSPFIPALYLLFAWGAIIVVRAVARSASAVPAAETRRAYAATMAE